MNTMNPKISVLLSTNRINKKVYPYMQKCMDGLENLQDGTFTEEFHDLALDRLYGISHILEPTFRSLQSQTFKDFELIISHKYPEDAIGIVKEFNFPIQLLREKPSIWHALGEKYHTVANTKNTAFIQSTGELIYHIDDLTLFNKNLLQEAWDLYQDRTYVTGRTVRCITYDKDFKDEMTRLGPMKTRITRNGWRGEEKPLSLDRRSHPPIPMNVFWTCSASVSAEDLIQINGYDELYDGSLTGIDMDAGNRLSYISKYNRSASDNYLYEINDPTDKYITRDDVIMRQLWGVNHRRANTWRPNPRQIMAYERWHTKNIGELDKNWNKFMDVPMYDIKTLYKAKIEEVIYDNGRD